MTQNTILPTMSAEKLDYHSVTGSADPNLTSLHITLNGSQTPEKWQHRLLKSRQGCNHHLLDFHYCDPYPETLLIMCSEPRCHFELCTERTSNTTHIPSWPVCIWLLHCCGQVLIPGCSVGRTVVRNGSRRMQSEQHSLIWGPAVTQTLSEGADNWTGATSIIKYGSPTKRC